MRATRSLTQRKMLDPEKAFLMAARSAGILMYRLAKAGAEVLLVHPGGPFWSRRDLGAWSIPKGEIDPGETAEEAAANSARSWARRRPALSSRWAAFGNVPARASRPSQWKATWKRIGSSARRKWSLNGRVAAVASGDFRRSTGRRGSRCRRRGCGCWRRKLRSSIASRRCCGTVTLEPCAWLSRSFTTGRRWLIEFPYSRCAFGRIDCVPSRSARYGRPARTS